MALDLWNTIYMVFTSAFFAILIGLPLGIVLASQGPLYKILNALVNIGRSIPFAILLIVLIPFTRMLIGTSLGTTAAIVPLAIAAIPFFARLIETSLKEVDPQILEAAKVMGSSPWQMVVKVWIPEALPSIYSAITLTLINLVGYSTMAGLVGGGGLGQAAIQHGYYRFDTFIMTVTIVLLVLLVQTIQWVGNYISKSILRKRGSHE